ncbi:hypothetical protein BDV93DRAFT_594337 [Ceratobasidium sp. AG-I]|nr:hypothetical protein BDV93DRAFT_594337 [Ceratobasidium sp. AG-I]
MNCSSPNVLIVGAGPAGMALALCLLQNDVAVRIIDRAPGPNVGQRGAATQPRALELYSLLGVPDIVKGAGPLQKLVFHDTPDHTQPPDQAPLVPEEPSPDIPFPNLAMISQDRAEAILRARLESGYGTFIEFGTALETLQQDDNHVTVRLVKSTGGVDTEETMTVRWLVGADGSKSIVRKLAGISFVGETRVNERYILGDVHIHCDLSREVHHRWGKLSNGIALRPSEDLEDTLFQFMISGLSVPYDKLMSDHNALLEYISNGVGDVKLEFGELVLVDDWTPNIRMVNKFSDGRVFIIGDAAHIHCTTGGQGVVSCLQDSVNLGWKMALVERGLAPRSLLDSYHEERYPVIADMLRITTSLFDGCMTGRGAPWRNIMKKLRQFGVNYQWSSIVVGTPQVEDRSVGTYGASGTPLCAGDRAPEAPGLIDIETQEETSVFNILSCSKHTVFVLADSVATAKPFFHIVESDRTNTFNGVLVLPASKGMVLGERLARVRVLSDRHGNAFRAYSLGEGPTAVAVRPDGMIGALTGQCEALQKYYNLIFSV